MLIRRLAALAALVFLVGGFADAQWFDEYKSYAEYNLKLDEFAANYPTLVTPFTTGLSFEGRPIRGIKITGTGTPSVAKKAVAIDGLTHAREWISGTTNMYVADRLLSGYGTDSRVTNLLDNVEFLITPITNPDGYEYTRNTNRLWRKNRRLNSDGSFGVDLNRNFGVGWGLSSGSSGNPNSGTYRGTAPFSEPESQAIGDMFLANQQLVSYINFHSYSQLLLSPWGYTTSPLPADEAGIFDRLSSEMASTIQSVHGEVYQYGPAATTLYLASGIAADWAYGDQGVYSYVIELRPTDASPFGFELPPDQIIPTGQEIFPAMLDLAEFTMTLAGGDLNYDGLHDCTDVDTLVNSIVNGTNRAERDLTGDGPVDAADLTDWLARAGSVNLDTGNPFLTGDANLDGSVDGTDFNLWNSHKFTSTASWCSGDFNADGLVDGGDFNLWNAHKFTSSGMPVLVPEPASVLMVALLFIGCVRYRSDRSYPTYPRKTPCDGLA